MTEEWGPWIDHDGTCCPVAAGTFVEVRWQDGVVAKFIVPAEVVALAPEMTSCWHWAMWDWRLLRTHAFVVEYRIRRPRGMAVLACVLSDLPEQVDA